MAERFGTEFESHTSEQPRPGRVADHLVQILIEAGVDRVFGIPGGAISPLFDALDDAELEVVVAQHEAMATYLAYGWSRATGRPGVVLVTSGPGVLNTATPMAAARLDEVPIIVIAGDTKSDMAGRGALQDGGPSGLDVLHVMKPLTKHVEAIANPGRAAASLQQAVRVSMTHPRGPVLLNLAMDMAGADVAAPLYRGALGGVAPAAPSIAQSIADGLASAVRPVIWLGLGARLTDVGSTIVRLAERTRCPVLTDIEAKGVFPESHALSLGLFGVGSRGVAERYLAEGTDFLLTVGARLDDTTTGGYSDTVRSGGRMIQLDHSADRLNRAYAFDEVVLCDLAATLAEVTRRTPAPGPHLLLARDAAVRDAQRTVLQGVVPEMDRGPHHPIAVVRALQALLPRDTVFTTDIGNHLLFAAQHLEIDRADAFHVSNGLGGMGSGIGTAMGLAFAYSGRRPVVGICGDGSLRMVGNELATCAQHRIPVVLAVFNDGQLGMVEHGFERQFGRASFCASPTVDVVAFAHALGASAVRVERRQDLEFALKHHDDGPLVLDIPIRGEVHARNPRAEVFAFPSAGSPR